MPDSAQTHAEVPAESLVEEDAGRRAPRRWSRHLGRLVHGRDLPVIFVLVAIVTIVSVFHPTYLQRTSLINTAQFASYIGCMAVGTVFLLSMREIDLSVGAVYGLCAIVAARLMENGMNPWLAVVVALAAGCGCGAVNGIITNTLRIQSIVVTLGTLSMFSALSLIVAQDNTIVTLPTGSAFFTVLGQSHLGLPTSIWAFIVILAVGHVLYRHTRFGAHVRLAGSNPDAARLQGIPVARLRLTALILQSFLCAVIGVVTLAYLQSADPTSGVGYELSVIAAAIVGGTALAGGQGSVIGAGVGALIISSINTGLVQFGVTPDWSGFATGAIIIGAVTMDAFLRRRRLAMRALFDDEPTQTGAAREGSGEGGDRSSGSTGLAGDGPEKR
jgi:ribose transport system permease protein